MIYLKYFTKPLTFLIFLTISFFSISQKIDLTAENNTFNIAKPTQKGVYLLYIESEGKKLYAGKVII